MSADPLLHFLRQVWTPAAQGSQHLAGAQNADAVGRLKVPAQLLGVERALANGEIVGLGQLRRPVHGVVVVERLRVPPTHGEATPPWEPASRARTTRGSHFSAAAAATWVAGCPAGV